VARCYTGINMGLNASPAAMNVSNIAELREVRECSGAIVLYKIPRVIGGENRTFLGAEDYLRSNGVEVEVLQDEDCIRLMTEFIRASADLWNEDIGV
jgi:cytosine/creatinine deaminase